MKRFLRFRLFFQAGLAAALVIVLKLVADRFGWSVIAINTLTGSFFAGVFFTISIVFTGAMADFKEAEKIPGEMAVLLRALRADASLTSPPGNVCSQTADIVRHIEVLLSTITSNLRANHWHRQELDEQIDLINKDIAELWTKGVATGLLLKLRENLTNLDRLSQRLEYIAYTKGIIGAYVVCDFALAAVLLIFAFSHNEWGFGGMVLLASIAFVLTAIVLLIHDMDNPFEYDKNTVADVDMSALFKLEARWKAGQQCAG
jgi:hypothetical protein